jgi:hypothetical protein
MRPVYGVSILARRDECKEFSGQRGPWEIALTPTLSRRERESDYTLSPWERAGVRGNLPTLG